ncbi:MAG: rod-binding protein [Armatimonadetes bacterium]|nr:rod-binding protein [Armatimonadota bacterium]
MTDVKPILTNLPGAVPDVAPAQTRPDAQQEKLKKACQDFEAIFLRFILQKMRDTVPKDGLIENSDAQQTYQQMLDAAMADQMSRSGSFGLAEMLYKQMSLQDASRPAGEAGAAPGSQRISKSGPEK